MLSRYCVIATLVLAAAVDLISTGALAASAALGPISPLTDPARIQKLAQDAYIWGVAPEFIYRFSNYNELVTAPVNALGGGGGVAAWNNQATNAGNASALYLTAMLNLSGQGGRGATKELVLTVPPSETPSDTNYYVVALLDAFINDVGSIGTRTTPSADAQTYLLVGPTSQYAHQRIARIHGFTYRVMPFDTNRGWMITRIRADSLVPASDPASVTSILTGVVERFGLSTLAEFEARGHQPKYFEPGQYTPTPEQIDEAKEWQTAPRDAVAFFQQVGEALKLNPLPDATTGLNFTPLATLPSWIVPQSGAMLFYRNPSYGQRPALALFRPIGLTANGYAVPRNWGQEQIDALQAGLNAGHDFIYAKTISGHASAETNYWSYINSGIGTYPNTPDGYITRAVLTFYGGATMPQDNVYAAINNLNGMSDTQLDGNNTYKLRFKPPVNPPPMLPAVGTLPPTKNDSDGNPLGFWSITLYLPDPSESAAPFISQASVLNTAYSTANIPVTAVDPSTNMITVEPSAWGPLVADTPIFFGPTAARYGLTPGIPYYVATAPTSNIDPKTQSTTYSFKISTQWLQDLSPGTDSTLPVPIQFSGNPGQFSNLTNPGGPVNLQWGPIQPVSQLGSQQLTSKKLVKDPDGSVTIWIAPTRPPEAPPTNWIPSPSTAYYKTLYTNPVSTQIQLITRIYYPAPGSNTEASILPPPDGSMMSTYVYPPLQQQ